MQQQTYYQILGVPECASSVAIRQAWRRLARVHHPDRHQGDADAVERFQAVVEAFRVLSDAERRAAYDASLGNARTAQPRDGERDTARARPRGRVPDRAIALGISYAHNIAGGILEVPIPPVGRCDDCGGTGAVNGRSCERCRGSGHAEPTRIHYVPVSAGLNDGAMLRIPSAGWPSDAGRGDLVVTLRLEDPPGLRRSGATVQTRARVSRSLALKGGPAEATGPVGLFRFRLEPHTPMGARLRFPGMGLVPAPGAPRGDLEVVIEYV